MNGPGQSVSERDVRSRSAFAGPRRIEGYAIVSEDGMLADAAGVMPAALKFEADRRFFESSLDGVDVVVLGRHSREEQPNSPLRRRLILTRKVKTIESDPSDDKALLWNPDGTTFEEALFELNAPGAVVAVIGGPSVFGLFLDRYDLFYLTRGAKVRLPGGRPVFPGVPSRTPEEILSGHGLRLERRRLLDAEDGLTVEGWRRTSEHQAPSPGAR
jgi:hypothetical protein